jgi:glycosyltransferase involved in cell wall biosynthesis
MVTPEKVLTTGGREVGGLTAFANGLSEGFAALGIRSEVIPPNEIFRRWRDLRDANVLKILSTTAVFAVPFARRAICVAHGFPCAAYQGWMKVFSIIGSFKLAKLSGAVVIAVSHYSAIHLKSVFDLEVDAVIHNPLRPLFLEPFASGPEARNYITYVGRLHAVKNLHRLMPNIRDLLSETPGLRACFIGDGEQRAALQEMTNGDSAFQFTGTLDGAGVRDWLRRTRIFVSGCETEALGISYLEALSQGCAVVMPACGGGVEIALPLLGTQVQFLPLCFDNDSVLDALRRALNFANAPISLGAHEPKAVAKAYLRVDSHFSPRGRAPAAYPSRGRADVDTTTALAHPGKGS